MLEYSVKVSTQFNIECINSSNEVWKQKGKIDLLKGNVSKH